MERRPFFRRARSILLVALIMPLISSSSAAQTKYSMEVVTPSYVETDQTDSVLPLTGKDDASTKITLPFWFTFYGKAYKEAYVSTNGFLNFIDYNRFYENTEIPTEAVPNAAIYAFWDDLYVDYSARVRTKTLGAEPDRQFVIEWFNVALHNNIPMPKKRVDFEIVLYEAGPILLQYANIADDDQEMGNSATVGVEDETGRIAMQFSYDEPAIGSDKFAILFTQGAKAVPVAVDIKPGACPNPLNVGSKGVLPVAILGTKDFKVETIDPTSIRLGGVRPIRSSFEDVGTPYEPYVDKIDPYPCNTLGPDGHLDMVFKFDNEAIAAALGSVSDKEVIILELSGKLLDKDESEIEGKDVVIIIKKGKEK